MIEIVFGFFALSWVPWALSGLIILGAMVIWLRFRAELHRVLGGLREALVVIEEVGGPAAFRDRLPSISARLAANPVIGDAWRAFAQTLVQMPGEDGVMGATRRPVEDFNENILTRAGVNLRFYTAVPNYLVGIGLFFTFLGLVAALYFASAGVAAADVQRAQVALQHLLAAATFKFVTSIAGLGASIIYSWREKLQLYRLGHELGRFCTALEERLVPLTPEYLGTLQLREMRSQSTLLRRLGRNLHVAIPHTVEERIAEELLDAIQPLREGFAHAAERIGQLDERVLATLATPAPSPAATAPTPTANALDDRAAAALVTELRRLREAIETMPGPATAPASAAGRDDRFERALDRFVQLFEASSAGIAALDARLGAALADIRGNLDRLAGEPLRGRTQTARQDLEEGLQGLNQARQHLEELGQAFRSVAGDTRTMLAACHATDAERDPQLHAALKQLSESADQFYDRVRRFGGRIEQELARSSKLLASVMERDQDSE